MPIVRTSKEITAAFAILRDVLHGVVMPVEDRNFPMLVHSYSKTARHHQDSL